MTLKKKLTLDDLSDHLKLSKFSISRALTGKKGVSAATRDLVINAARELGYGHPGTEATPHTSRNTVHLVIPRQDAIDNPTWIEAIGGAQQEARGLGWMLVTSFAEDAGNFEDIDSKTSGILLAGRRSRGQLESFMQLDVPVVLIGYPKPGELLDTVHVADWEGGFVIGEHLRSLGHRNITFVTDAPSDFGRQERLRGVRDAFANEADIAQLLFDPETERDPHILYKALQEKASKATAIVCASESVTLSVLMALKDAGVSVPDEISVVGSYGTARPAQYGFDATSLAMSMSHIGALAIDMLRRRIAAGPMETALRIAIRPELRIRGTSGRAPH